ncbi:MAG: sigma 54-interacting transcriptional regulator [Holophagaceae bacterium]
MIPAPALRACWLGHWKAPWPMTRGRRWGDRAWALAALGQAWVLGGRDRRWPVAEWIGRRPQPPRLVAPPEAFQPVPPEAWVALLRHGSAQADATRRGARESELEGACWEALLAGDGAPWMALGSLLLDLPTRLAWVPLLGAVAPDGGLLLPPFLEDLVPPDLRILPPGWWEILLSRMDPEGRLLPEGDPPAGLSWGTLRPRLEPFLPDPGGRGEPPDLPQAFLHELPDGRVVVHPNLRAWARGWGAGPGGLQGFAEAGGLAVGQEPEAGLAELLAGRLPGLVPPGWEAALRADLEEQAERPACPPPAGHPVWDRVRARWGGQRPEPGPGYPSWGSGPHPCADPFHWMAEGIRAFQAVDLETSLWAFRLAFAHFQRLASPTWAERAASNAAQAALMWADMGAYRFYRAMAKPRTAHHRRNEEAFVSALYGDLRKAEAIWQDLTREIPEFPEAWINLADLALAREDLVALKDLAPRVRHEEFRRLLDHILAGARQEPEGLTPPFQVRWRIREALQAGSDMAPFWETWEACVDQWQRLETGLLVLEARPDARTGYRLVALQAIAARAESVHHLARLQALWPAPPKIGEADPRSVIDAWMRAHPGPAWFLHGGSGWPLQFGRGPAPPTGLLTRLRAEGAVAPLEAEGWVWRGLPLAWEGETVGACLLGSAPADAPVEAEDPGILAPWLARLNPLEPVPPPDAASGLLHDGSEPMASLMRDLARVAPSPLPVLLLGPTGSGKELAAREVHRLSGRPGPLVPVNCSALAESLLESELFGHVKGAFTGADRERRGAIEQAEGGTLFLDEIADVSPRVQSLLLRVLQEREVRRVGGERAVAVDVRFVAATHKSLDELAATGAFRQDLLFRLKGTVLRMPTLAERRHEFAYLLPRLVAQAAKGLGRPAPDLSAGLAEALARLPWPGNVRELRHALDRALLRCGEGPLKPSHFPELEAPDATQRRWADATHAFQKDLLLETLRRHGFNAAAAADALGLARPAIYLTAKRLGIDLVAERLRSP